MQGNLAWRLALQKRGYKADDIRGFLHGNWVRFFREAWRRT